MLNERGLVVVAAIVLAVLLCGTVPTVGCARSVTDQKRDGDEIVIVLNKIKGDKKQQFEEFLTKLVAAVESAAQSDTMIRRVAAQTRTLFPTEANADGTYTYVFLQNPHVEGGEYDMAALLGHSMPQLEVDRLLKQMFECYAAPQEVLALRERAR